jgi:coenzyme F420-reducing hydrogenase beta subunit
MQSYISAIRLSIAVFCTGIYHPDLIEDLLVQQMGISRDQVKRVEVSADQEWMHVVLWDGSVRSISRQAAEKFTRPGCASCDDYLGESADLAIGIQGAGEGTSTVIARSRTGEVFLRNAVQMHLLETNFNIDLAALAAAAAEKDRRERAQTFKGLKVLNARWSGRPAPTWRSDQTVRQVVPDSCALRKC